VRWARPCIAPVRARKSLALREGVSYTLVHMVREFSGDVYRCYNAEGELLYIGSTFRHAAVRLTHHRYTQPWWGEVAEVRIEKHPYSTLRAVEFAAIRDELPLYNVIHNPRFAREPQEPVCPFFCMAEIWLGDGTVKCCEERRGHDGNHVRGMTAWSDGDPGAEPDDLSIEFAGVPYRRRRARCGG
jgi:hypothetical protein